MSFDAEGFTEIAKGSGVIKIDMAGDIMEMPYDATFYMNEAGTVAVAETPDPMEGITKYIFLSKTAAREVMTISGRQTNAVEVEGVLLNTLASTDREEMLGSHLGAIGSDAVSDADGLAKAIEEVPQRSADLSMKLLAQMMAAF